MMDTLRPGCARWLAPLAALLAFVTSASVASAAPGDDAAVQTPRSSDAAPPSADADDAEPAEAAATTNPPKIAPPAALPVESAPAPLAGNEAASDAAPSWFARAPLTLGVGTGDQKWSVTFYGFVEADFIADSTRSYDDAIGGDLVARSDTYAGQTGRTQFSMRNTRLGMRFDSPTVGGVKPSAIIEGDFFGQAHSSETTEHAFFDSPTFRLRSAYFTLQNEYVDVLAGKAYDVFGWQNYFFPCTAAFLGLPNQVFSRNAQFRLSHRFVGPVSLDVAASANRPGQRDSGVPDFNAGLRLAVDSWQGISTPGNTGTLALPLSIGVSAVARQFKVNSFTPPPSQRSNTASGWGVSIDGLVPVIPAKNANDRGNKLTLVGSFVTGTGIADLLTVNGGAEFPTLPNPAQGNPAPLYNGNVDNGLVTFDTQGVLHTIDWRTFKVGVQYYLPPSGRLIFSANYTEARSNNMQKLFPKGGAEIELLGRVANRSRYADVNLFWDATPAVRFGLSGQYTTVTYLDGNQPNNKRGMLQALYVF